MSAFEQLLKGWDGEQVTVRYEPDLDAWMFIGVHSTVRGPAGGGTRLRVYSAPEHEIEPRTPQNRTFRPSAKDSNPPVPLRPQSPRAGGSRQPRPPPGRAGPRFCKVIQ